MALGCLGLSLDYFYSLTPRQFSNTVNGYRKKEDNLSQERWLMTRKIMWATMAPHYKNLKEQDLIEFAFETNKLEKINLEELVALEEEIDEVKEFYRKRDENKKSQSE